MLRHFSRWNFYHGSVMQMEAYRFIKKEIAKKCGGPVEDMVPDYEKYEKYHDCYKRVERKFVSKQEQEDIDD